MLGDLRERLEPLGRLDVMSGLGEVITDYYQQRREGINDAAADIRYSQALGVLAEIASELGQYERALQLNGERAKILEHGPSNDADVTPELELERADTLRQRARIQSDMKNPGGAAADLKAAIGILNNLDSPDGDRESHLRLATLLGEHSAALTEQGDEPNAKASLSEALHHWSRAKTAADLTSDEILLAVRLLLQCDQLALPNGQIPSKMTADSSRGEAKLMLDGLLAANPDDYPLRFRIAELLHRLSPDIRGELYFVADRLCAELVARDPTNQHWRELQAEIQVVIGYELTQLGQRGEALPYLEQGSKTLKELAQLQPDHPRILHRLAMAHRFLGWWQLLTGDRTAAQASFRQGIATIQPLMSDDSNDAGLVYTYTFLHIWLGESLRAPAEKAAAIRPVLALIDRTGLRLPGDEAVQLARFQAHDRLSDFLRKVGDLEQAEEQNRLARQAVAEYRDAAVPNARLRRLRAAGWRTRARLLWQTDRRKEALVAYREYAVALADLVKKPELHARENSMTGLCGALHQILYCPMDDPARELDFVREHADLLEQYLSDIEADESRLPEVLHRLRNVWRVAAVQAGKNNDRQREAGFYDRAVALAETGRKLSDPTGDVGKTIRSDALTFLVGDDDLRRFAQAKGKWPKILNLAVALGHDLTNHDDAKLTNWRRLATALMHKAVWHRDQGESAEARESFVAYENAARRAVQLEDDQFNADDWQRYASRHMLGQALIGQERYEETEAVLKEAFAEMERLAGTIPADQRQDYLATADQLVSLYLKWEKLDDAKKWQEKLTQLRQ